MVLFEGNTQTVGIFCNSITNKTIQIVFMACVEKYIIPRFTKRGKFCFELILVL